MLSDRAKIHHTLRLFSLLCVCPFNLIFVATRLLTFSLNEKRADKSRLFLDFSSPYQMNGLEATASKTKVFGESVGV